MVIEHRAANTFKSGTGFNRMVPDQRAADDAELREHSCSEFLDGYEFERATAEVLKRHQFNPSVKTRSTDGYLDVTRGGLDGIVQCKPQGLCVGLQVVRDF